MENIEHFNILSILIKKFDEFYYCLERIQNTFTEYFLKWLFWIPFWILFNSVFMKVFWILLKVFVSITADEDETVS